MESQDLAIRLSNRVSEVQKHNDAITEAQENVKHDEQSLLQANTAINKARAELRVRRKSMQEEAERVDLMKFRSVADEIRSVVELDTRSET